jgi:AraC-like DNA-binding protein
MPIYMDRHDVSDVVTAEAVAQLHQQDLKIQEEFNCKGLTYWFDGNRKTAFCLVEAPNKQCLIDMHNHAHGEIPNQIIEVDVSVVESFLGRIEDPEKSHDSELNIIDDPAFRIIMYIGFSNLPFSSNKIADKGFESQARMNLLSEVFSDFEGRIVTRNHDHFIVSFNSGLQAAWCAIEVHNKFQEWEGNAGHDIVNLKTGISAGVPVTNKKLFFEEALQSAERMYHIAHSRIVVSSEVKKLCKQANSNVFVDTDLVYAMTPSDEQFLEKLMNYISETWQNPDLHVDKLGLHLGFSKSQLYRKITSLVGISPNNFIKDFRLNKAVSLIHAQTHTISEVAYETGFNSPSYFTKCFFSKYGLLPSQYQNIIAE